MDVHNLTNNFAITSKHDKGDSGKRAILAGNVSRNSYRRLKARWGKSPKLDDSNSRYTSDRERHTPDIETLPSVKDRNRLGKSIPSTVGGRGGWGGGFLGIKSKNPTRRKGPGREGSWKWKFAGVRKLKSIMA